MLSENLRIFIAGELICRVAAMGGHGPPPRHRRLLGSVTRPVSASSRFSCQDTFSFRGSGGLNDQPDADRIPNLWDIEPPHLHGRNRSIQALVYESAYALCAFVTRDREHFNTRRPSHAAYNVDHDCYPDGAIEARVATANLSNYGFQSSQSPPLEFLFES